MLDQLGVENGPALVGQLSNRNVGNGCLIIKSGGDMVIWRVHACVKTTTMELFLKHSACQVEWIGRLDSVNTWSNYSYGFSHSGHYTSPSFRFAV